MVWTRPQHTRQQVNNAGIIFVGMLADFQFDKISEWREALSVMSNWRSSHSYPLNTFQVNLRRTASRVDDNALVAQRIKRLSSISHKLQRFPTMRLSQMQDIGGCRAVVKSVASVRDLVDLYDNSRMKHSRANIDDYIEQPRPSGYRGIHMIYRYFSDRESTAIYNGLQIEMQLRSLYQHAWATAVETVGAFVQQALKSSIGEGDWLRFFSLMGTAVALREKSPLVPGTPTDRRELVDELAHYANKLDVKSRLNAYGTALRTVEQHTDKRSHYYLLKLDPSASQITVTGFTWSDLERASDLYLEAEEEVRNQPGSDAVLVSVDSLTSLRRAYPNYFADTGVFVELMRQALSGRRRKIFTGSP